MNLGARIRAEREKREWTQQELALRAGLPAKSGQQVIQALEERNSTRSKHAPALARALGLSLEWALTGEGPKYDEGSGLRISESTHTYSPEAPAMAGSLDAGEVVERIARVARAAAGDDELIAFLAHLANLLEKRTLKGAYRKR